MKKLSVSRLILKNCSNLGEEVGGIQNDAMCVPWPVWLSRLERRPYTKGR